VLQALVRIKALDDFHVGELLQTLTGAHPREVATLLVRRLDEYGKREGDYAYRPVPDFMRHELHAMAPHAAETLRGLRDAVPVATPRLHQELIDMFWTMGGQSTQALTLVDEWLHSTEPDLVKLAIRFVADAPHRLSLDRPVFAGHVVNVFEEPKLRESALRAVVSNCRPQGWSRKKGQKPSEHETVGGDARELARTWAGTFVAKAMARIADDIDRESRAIAAEDDEL
jgi:hypothetical protein